MIFYYHFKKSKQLQNLTLTKLPQAMFPPILQSQALVQWQRFNWLVQKKTIVKEILIGCAFCHQLYHRKCINVLP